MENVFTTLNDTNLLLLNNFAILQDEHSTQPFKFNITFEMGSSLSNSAVSDYLEILTDVLISTWINIFIYVYKLFNMVKKEQTT